MRYSSAVSSDNSDVFSFRFLSAQDETNCVYIKEDISEEIKKGNLRNQV